MNKEKIYLEKIEVLRKALAMKVGEIERLNKQLNKPTRKVGIGVKK